MTTPSRDGGSAAGLLQRVDAAVDALDLARRSRELDRVPAFPWSEFREMGRLGLLGLRTPSALGGQGLSMPRAALALGRLAYRSGTTFAKLALQPEFCSILGERGSAQQRRTSFRPVCRGEKLIGNHVTEPTAGSDAGAIRTVARPVRAGYVLSGLKSQAAFAEDAEEAIVYARVPRSRRDPGRITAFLVPQDRSGIRRGAVADLGERWMRRGSVEYQEVELPGSARIGKEGEAFDALKRELTRERLLLAAIYLGVGRASFDETVAYAGLRSTFGRPLAQHESVGFRLVEDWVRLESAQLYVDRALARHAEGASVVGEAAMAKWLATETSLTAIDHAIQFHGGLGYSSALPHEQRWRDVRSGSIAHGTSEIMHLVASRSLWPSQGSRASANPPPNRGVSRGGGGGRLRPPAGTRR
ncbi:MAG TPA: acyl-CoA dehydrogenase family protein [Thermoplasmata archaeon]|nr:acyl-CoA dehydrogenase family protein [Thermoplasmata archaeon]